MLLRIKVIKDIQLIGHLTQILSIDMVILTLWTIIDPVTTLEQNIHKVKV